MFCATLHTLLTMTAEPMLSIRPVLRFTAALLFPLMFGKSYCFILASTKLCFNIVFLPSSHLQLRDPNVREFSAS